MNEQQINLQASKAKVIIVTGGTKGLGLQLVERLLAETYTVIALGRQLTPELDSLIKGNTDRKIYFVPFDLENVATISTLVTDIVKKHGEIFGLVNNAALGLDGVLATMHESDISRLLKVNLEAPMLLSKYVSRSMLRSGGGRIINISSICANTGYSGLSVYGATKAGLVGFTRSLSRELGRAKITVNAVLPGFMETSMTSGLDQSSLDQIKRRSPLKALVTPNDVFPMVKLLLSDEGRHMTGQCYTIDAGATA